MKVVIAGGTGFLGSPLAEAYAEEGHEVLVLTRSLMSGDSRHDPGTGVPGITRVGWTADGKTGSWAARLEAADAIVNLSGDALDRGRWTPQRKARLRDGRILATRSLAAAILSAAKPPAVFVSGSGVDYYASSNSGPSTESSPPGTGFLADLCKDWEAEAGRAESPGTRVVLLRSWYRVGAVWRSAAADDAALSILRRRQDRIRTAVFLVDSSSRLGGDGALDRPDTRGEGSDQRSGS